MSGEIRRVQAQCDEKICEYETKLELAHGNRMSSMFQMKEEVESEFTDRMEQVSLFTFFVYFYRVCLHFLFTFTVFVYIFCLLLLSSGICTKKRY